MDKMLSGRLTDESEDEYWENLFSHVEDPLSRDYLRESTRAANKQMNDAILRICQDEPSPTDAKETRRDIREDREHVSKG